MDHTKVERHQWRTEILYTLKDKTWLQPCTIAFVTYNQDNLFLHMKMTVPFFFLCFCYAGHLIRIKQSKPGRNGAVSLVFLPQRSLNH